MSMDSLSFLLPTPQKAERGDGFVSVEFFKVTSDPIDDCVYKSAVERLENAVSFHNEKTGGYPVELIIADVCDNKADSYVLDVTPDKAVISANDPGGLYYGAVTLVKLFVGGQIPVCHIEDWPDFKDRGLLLENRYGSDFMTMDDYRDAIDYLSKMKYNQLTIGIYGCWCVQYDMRLSEFLYIPLKGHPELQTPRDIRYWSPEKRDFVEEENLLPTMYAEDYFDELIKYAKTKNITIKPLFNSFGHNTLIPRLHPELSAKDENGKPTKHGYCVSDDAVYDFMFSIYDEIIDRYMIPNGLDAIEIGLDEVYAWFGEDLDDIYGKFEPYCRCEKCRSMDRKELMIKYIIRVCKYLKSKGMKSIYIYHDMLFEQFDIVNEELVELFKKEGIYDEVVLDWWYYTKEEDVFQKREINNLFRSITKPFTGYYHWVIPMEYNNNIYALAKLAKKHGFEGVESYSSFEYCFDRPFMYQAELSWNSSQIPEYRAFLDKYAATRFPCHQEKAKEILDIMEDLTTNDTKVNRMNGLEYYWYTYVAECEPYPRNFHGSVYSKIAEDKESYLEYFDSVIKKSSEAMGFFNSMGGKWFEIWYAIAKHYYTYAVGYATLTRLHDDYVEGLVDASRIVSELDRLIAMQEDFMKTVENTRIKANCYVYLRNHSITRQFYIDLRDYFKDAAEKGLRPEFRIDDFGYCLSERYAKLR